MSVVIGFGGLKYKIRVRMLDGELGSEAKLETCATPIYWSPYASWPNLLTNLLYLFIV